MFVGGVEKSRPGRYLRLQTRDASLEQARAKQALVDGSLDQGAHSSRALELFLETSNARDGRPGLGHRSREGREVLLREAAPRRAAAGLSAQHLLEEKRVDVFPRPPVAAGDDDLLPAARFAQQPSSFLERVARDGSRAREHNRVAVDLIPPARPPVAAAARFNGERRKVLDARRAHEERLPPVVGREEIGLHDRLFWSYVRRDLVERLLLRRRRHGRGFVLRRRRGNDCDRLQDDRARTVEVGAARRLHRDQRPRRDVGVDASRQQTRQRRVPVVNLHAPAVHGIRLAEDLGHADHDDGAGARRPREQVHAPGGGCRVGLRVRVGPAGLALDELRPLDGHARRLGRRLYLDPLHADDVARREVGALQGPEARDVELHLRQAVRQAAPVRGEGIRPPHPELRVHRARRVDGLPLEEPRKVPEPARRERRTGRWTRREDGLLRLLAEEDGRRRRADRGFRPKGWRRTE
mmetsp:Transcript_8348/g.23556  ORF Transcript_8348/g.23556 Transcript_8348/m.23556 type:complete len:467 (-) Transcript_8348:1097-2497(-)